MQQISYGGVSAWSDAACLHTNFSGSSVALLSLFGPRNAVRALWAKLSDRKRNFVHVEDGVTIELESGVSYVTLSATPSKQLLHMTLLHPAATHQCNPFAGSYYQIGADPSVRFFARLNRMCPIPFRPEWREYLWANGQVQGLIKPLDGWGMPGFKIDAGEAWADVVKAGILSGELK